ncbi:hypothetical protein [Goekera deserti]
MRDRGRIPAALVAACERARAGGKAG